MPPLLDKLGLVALVGAAFGWLLKWLFDRYVTGFFVKKGLIAHCGDLARHLIVNKLVIEEIIQEFDFDQCESIFRDIHLRRMMFLPNEFSFDQSVYRSIPESQANNIHRLAFIVRNIDLDVAEAIKIYESSNMTELPKFLETLSQRFENGARYMIQFLEKCGEKPLPPELLEAVLRKERQRTIFSQRKLSRTLTYK